jgi:hypothetical protein
MEAAVIPSQHAIDHIVIEERRTPCLEGAAAAQVLCSVCRALEVVAPLQRSFRQSAFRNCEIKQRRIVGAIGGRTQQHWIDQHQPLHKVGPAPGDEQRHSGAHRMSAEHRAARRGLFQHLDHIVPEAVPGFHASRMRRKFRSAMPAHVDGRHVRLSAQRLEQRLVGDGVEAGGVQEQDLDRLHGVAEGNAGRFTVPEIQTKPTH